MKKRVLFIYLTVITSLISLQSCATNYVIADPALYNKEYKSDAKLSSLETNRFEKNKQTLINSFVSERNAKNAVVNTLEKNTAIANSIKISQTIDGILQEAATYLGTPYRFGGTTRNGIDCSAFVLSVFGAAAGVHLPRVAASQAHEGDSVDKSELVKGDLVFFSHGRGRISHVGIVESVSPEGEVKFIHAATSKGVMVSSLTDSYWGPRFRFAKRIINEVYLEQMNNLATTNIQSELSAKNN